VADEHVFYIAGAAVVGVASAEEYTLWLLDHTNDDKLNKWDAGAKVDDLDKKRIVVHPAFTFESPGPGGVIDTVDDQVMKKLEKRVEKRLRTNLWRKQFSSAATVVVSETLLNQIAEVDRPLPKGHRDQPYRLQLLARRDDAGAVKYYFGFHVKVIATASSGHPIVRFFDWEDRKLGSDEVDLSSPAFEPQGKYTKIPPAPPIGSEGALFVALDAFSTLLFLDAPKVPFGAGQHAAGHPHDEQVAGGAVARVAPASATVEPPPIVVASGGQDSWLAAAREVVVGEGVAKDEDGVIREITRLLDSARDRNAIELLSHSDDDNLLTFDGWTVDVDAFVAASAPFKDSLRGKVIRLVGCATARGPRAQDALRALQDHLGVAAFGTGGLIGTTDLSPEGSAPAKRPQLFEQPDSDAQADAAKESAEFLVTDQELRRGGAPFALLADDRSALVAGLTPESRRVAKSVLGLMPSVAYPFTGILRKPSATLVLTPDHSASPPGRPGRIDALFRGQLIRFTRGQRGRAGYLERLFWIEDTSVRAQLQEIFHWRPDGSAQRKPSVK
jgi:hypothetical protein